jgi:hypothetical protein
MRHANPDHPANPPSAANEGPARPGEQPPAPLPEIPPGIAASQAAFQKAKPELLKKRPHQWVAFHGDELIGFAKSQFNLYKECFRRGLTDDSFVVRLIMEEEMSLDTECTVAFDV